MSSNVNAGRYIICPCIEPDKPNACYDVECLRANECLDLKYGGQEVKAIAAANAAVKDTREYGSASSSFVCPDDQGHCSMLSCKDGQDCYRRRKAAGQTSGQQYVAAHPIKECHTGMNFVGHIGGAKLYLGREFDAKVWKQQGAGDIALAISLLGEPIPQGTPIGYNRAALELPNVADLVSSPQPIPSIWIKWPDYGIVSFDRAWWDKLMGMFDEIEGNVLMYCMGGHGRTGTAAAIICTLGGLVPAEQCPVLWLRAMYCDKVVESNSQLDYIEHITGRKVVAGCSKGLYSYSQHKAPDVKKNTTASPTATTGPVGRLPLSERIATGLARVLGRRSRND